MISTALRTSITFPKKEGNRDSITDYTKIHSIQKRQTNAVYQQIDTGAASSPPNLFMEKLKMRMLRQ